MKIAVLSTSIFSIMTADAMLIRSDKKPSVLVCFLFSLVESLPIVVDIWLLLTSASEKIVVFSFH